MRSDRKNGVLSARSRVSPPLRCSVCQCSRTCSRRGRRARWCDTRAALLHGTRRSRQVKNLGRDRIGVPANILQIDAEGHRGVAEGRARVPDRTRNHAVWRTPRHQAGRHNTYPGALEKRQPARARGFESLPLRLTFRVVPALASERGHGARRAWSKVLHAAGFRPPQPGRVLRHADVSRLSERLHALRQTNRVSRRGELQAKIVADPPHLARVESDPHRERDAELRRHHAARGSPLKKKRGRRMPMMRRTISPPCRGASSRLPRSTRCGSSSRWQRTLPTPGAGRR